eukprot:356491-Chlamydomonas_euryale.AAC.2
MHAKAWIGDPRILGVCVCVCSVSTSKKKASVWAPGTPPKEEGMWCQAARRTHMLSVECVECGVRERCLQRAHRQVWRHPVRTSKKKASGVKLRGPGSDSRT